MQTALPTQEDIARWKEVFAEYHTRLKPNRINGEQLRDYLTAHYPAKLMQDAEMDQVVTGNILANECYSRTLPEGASPSPVCFKLAREGAAGVAVLPVRLAVEHGVADGLTSALGDLFLHAAREGGRPQRGRERRGDPPPLPEGHADADGDAAGLRLLPPPSAEAPTE